MSFRIEMGVDPDEGLSLALTVKDRFTGADLDATLVDHEMVLCGDRYDYGSFLKSGIVVATSFDGSISSPLIGVLVVNLPGQGAYQPACPSSPPLPFGIPAQVDTSDFSALDFSGDDFDSGTLPIGLFASNADFDPRQFSPDFAIGPPPPSPPNLSLGCCWFHHDRCGESLKFKLFAISRDRSRSSVIAHGTISIGDAAIPRLTFEGYPSYADLTSQAKLGIFSGELMAFSQYSNAPTASVLTCSVAQMKTILAQQGLYDRVEQSLGGTTDPATIAWNSGGDMRLGGPLANIISAASGPGLPIDVASLMNLAANLTV